ncbi:PHP domain-containing protein [Desulfonema limicola]|uniref:PHP domain-containing protein n=1 Tax=Desulfonema limicola TaxID=45656 RepID=A0A975B6D0_9BACT|nr:PHP domain-containing protein [Desulfonema limicola]QTA79584.1 PHP domain-containing protein [Desulfonema limicola]
MQEKQADLHIHTCLSPCGDWDMSPKNIVQKSCEKGLDIIAVCDHNSVENAGAVIKAGREHGICVFPGMEICSKEEVHILAVFNTLEQGLIMQEYVYAHLPGQNKPDYFGYQVIVDENDMVIGENPRLLIGATTLGLKDIVKKTKAIGGLSIAAHVDRKGFGLISQLGFIPPDLALDAVEVSWRISLKNAAKNIPGIGNLPCITSSDAHFPDDIGKASTRFIIDLPDIQEISFALQNINKRKIKV